MFWYQSPTAFGPVIQLSTLVQAGGIVLPTIAGSNQIWCGGQDVPIDPTTTVSFSGITASLSVSYSLNDLTMHSSPCSFQGIVFSSRYRILTLT